MRSLFVSPDFPAVLLHACKLDHSLIIVDKRFAPFNGFDNSVEALPFLLLSFCCIRNHIKSMTKCIIWASSSLIVDFVFSNLDAYCRLLDLSACFTSSCLLPYNKSSFSGTQTVVFRVPEHLSLLVARKEMHGHGSKCARVHVFWVKSSLNNFKFQKPFYFAASERVNALPQLWCGARLLYYVRCKERAVFPRSKMSPGNPGMCTFFIPCFQGSFFFV